jgi:hypothetical protein
LVAFVLAGMSASKSAGPATSPGKPAARGSFVLVLASSSPSGERLSYPHQTGATAGLMKAPKSQSTGKPPIPIPHHMSISFVGRREEDAHTRVDESLGRVFGAAKRTYL